MRAEDGRVRQQRHGILRVLAQPFERRKQKCLVFLNRKSDGAAELLPAQRVFHVRALRIGQAGIKRLARLQRLADSERVCGIQRVIAEKTKKASMQLVRPRLRDDINDRSAGTAQLGRIITSINLKLLHGFLAQRQSHAAGIIVSLSAIHSHAVAPAIASVEGKSALRSLLDAKLQISGKSRGIGNAGHERRVSEVVPPSNGQLSDELLVDRICLAATLGFHHRQFRRHHNHLRH